MAKRRENVSGLCLRGGKQGFLTAASAAVTSLRGRGQVSGWCSRGRAVPKFRLQHRQIFSHPVKTSMRKSTSKGQWQPGCVFTTAQDLWFSSPSPSFKAPTDTWVCHPPHRIFRLSIFLLQGISIDATSQLASVTQSCRICPRIQDSLTEPSLPL